MIATNMADRLALIAAIAEKHKNEKARKERLATIRKNAAKVRIVARKKRTAEDKKLSDFTWIFGIQYRRRSSERDEDHFLHF